MGLLQIITIGGIGYVLGARAGRARYEQIVDKATKVWESAPVQKGRDTVRDQTAQAFHAATEAAGAKFTDVKDSVADSVKEAMRARRGAPDEDEIIIEVHDDEPVVVNKDEQV
ncbi:MAG: hypothetical protein WBH82_00005 [Arcanobacterium sp.]